MLEELDRAGFPMGDPDGAHVMQRYKRYSWLTASGGFVHRGDAPGLDLRRGASDPQHAVGVVFGADVVGLSDGTPSAETLNDICDRFGPRKSAFVGTWIIVSAPSWGFPIGAAWGDSGRTWGGGSTRFVAPTTI